MPDVAAWEIEDRVCPLERVLSEMVQGAQGVWAEEKLRCACLDHPHCDSAEACNHF